MLNRSLTFNIDLNQISDVWIKVSTNDVNSGLTELPCWNRTGINGYYVHDIVDYTQL